MIDVLPYETDEDYAEWLFLQQRESIEQQEIDMNYEKVTATCDLEDGRVLEGVCTGYRMPATFNDPEEVEWGEMEFTLDGVRIYDHMGDDHLYDVMHAMEEQENMFGISYKTEYAKRPQDFKEYDQ